MKFWGNPEIFERTIYPPSLIVRASVVAKLWWVGGHLPPPPPRPKGQEKKKRKKRKKRAYETLSLNIMRKFIMFITAVCVLFLIKLNFISFISLNSKFPNISHF